MRKRLLAIVATAAMLVAMVPAMAFAGTTMPAAVDGVITLTEDVTLSDQVLIKESVVIDGNGKTITTTARKAFEIDNAGTEVINVTFKNVTIINKSNGAGANPRCIDARNGDINLVLENVTLDATEATGNSDGYNPMGLVIGGSHAEAIDVTINKSVINGGYSGYGIVTFNPVNMDIVGSEVSGYAAMYLKGEVSSMGSAGSVINIKNSTVAEGVNKHSGESNAFGTIVFEDDDIVVNVDGSTVSGKATGDQPQTVFLQNSYYATFTKANTVNIYNGSKIIADNSETIATVSATNKVVFKDATCSVEIPAEFIAEGYAQDKTTGVVSKIETNKPEASPATGDNSMAPIAVAGLVMAAMAAVVATRRRTN